MIVAYSISTDFNGSRMLGYKSSPALAQPYPLYGWRYILDGKLHPATCPTCGRKTDPDYVDPTFKVRKWSFEFSSTYDGYTIVSDRFRKFCRSRRLPGMKFVKLPAAPGFFWLRLSRVLPFDVKRRGTRVSLWCPTCRHFHSVAGATPAFIWGLKKPLKRGFYRTDLEFASGSEQSPLEIVGIETADELQQEHFKKILLKPIES